MEKLIDIWDRYKTQCLVIIALLGVGIYYLTSSHGTNFENNSPVSQAVMATSTSELEKSHDPSTVITVDVKGAVKQPGVYELKGDSRINEALQAAGGPLATADLRQVNLAKQLTDQQMIYIPVQGEQVANPDVTSMSTDGNGGATTGSTSSSRVNLNTATKDQLCQINGIGDKKADLILQYRQEHGQFKSVEELQGINGFGEKAVAKLKDSLSV